MYIPPEIHFRDINIEGDIIGCVCVLVSGRDDTYITTPPHLFQLPLLFTPIILRGLRLMHTYYKHD